MGYEFWRFAYRQQAVDKCDDPCRVSADAKARASTWKPSRRNPKSRLWSQWTLGSAVDPRIIGGELSRRTPASSLIA